MKYRKKPVMIEAFCLGFDSIPDWFMNGVTSDDIILYGERGRVDYCEINTLEGVMKGNRGDWIIQGVQGEIYPCKPNVFEQTYTKYDTEAMLEDHDIAINDFMDVIEAERN